MKLASKKKNKNPSRFFFLNNSTMTSNPPVLKGIYNIRVKMVYHPYSDDPFFPGPICNKIVTELQKRDFNVPDVCVCFKYNGPSHTEWTKCVDAIYWNGNRMFLTDDGKLFSYWEPGLKMVFRGQTDLTPQQVEENTNRIFGPLLEHILKYPVCWPEVSTFTDSRLKMIRGKVTEPPVYEEYPPEWPTLYAFITDDLDRACVGDESKPCRCRLTRLQRQLQKDFGGDLYKMRESFFGLEDFTVLNYYCFYGSIKASFSKVPTLRILTEKCWTKSVAILAIRPHYVDQIYVVDREEYNRCNRGLSGASLKVINEKNEEGLLRQKATTVTLKHYIEEGLKYEKPLVFICKGVGIDEIQIETPETPSMTWKIWESREW